MLNLRSYLSYAVLLFAGFSAAQSGPVRVASPNDQLVITLTTAPAQAEPNAPPRQRAIEGLRYSVQFHGKPLMAESPLGLKLEGSQADLGPSMHLVNQQPNSAD